MRCCNAGHSRTFDSASFVMWKSDEIACSTLILAYVTYARGGAKRYWAMNWRDGIRASDIPHTGDVSHSDDAIAASRSLFRGPRLHM